MTGLCLAGIACDRGDRRLFHGIDLVLGSGDAALVTGPNGAGKSSLIRIAAGLLRPAAGAVTRDGSVALTDERTALDPTLPLARALDFWARIDGSKALLDRFGLATLAEVPVRFLSTGQRKRAALARIIASGAALWLLDEPEAGLDNEGRAALDDMLAAHRAGGGVAVVAAHRPPALPGAVAVRLGA